MEEAERAELSSRSDTFFYYVYGECSCGAETAVVGQLSSISDCSTFAFETLTVSACETFSGLVIMADMNQLAGSDPIYITGQKLQT